MQSITADLDRLQLTIQRLMDADLLLEAEAARLLESLEDVRREQQSVEPDAILRLLDHLSPLIEMLAGPNPPDARAIVRSQDIH